MRVVAALLLVALIGVGAWTLTADGGDKPAGPGTGQRREPNGGFDFGDFGGGRLMLPPNAHDSRQVGPQR